jgi:dipeptidyl aminopeptidase/acylaminoacyl peptidase
VSGGRDWRLSLWLPGKSAQAIDAHLAAAEVTAVRWSPDGRRVAVGEAGGGIGIYAILPAP